MEKAHILESTYRLFTRYGIKRVSMDSLAGKFRISKRTLYEFFDDKKSLVTQSVGHMRRRLHTNLKQIEDGCQTPLEAALITAIKTYNLLNPQCEAFRDELPCYMDAVGELERLRTDFQMAFLQRFREGVAQGSLLPNQNYELLASVCWEHISGGNLISGDFNNVLYTLLRGCATPVGLIEMERLNAQWQERQFYSKHL